MSSITTTLSAIGVAVISVFTNTNTEQINLINQEEPTIFSAEEQIIKVEPVAYSTDSTMPYYIKVNISQNVVNIYKKDENGDYSILETTMLCSTGTATPKSGKKFKITSYRTLWNKLKGNVYGQYAVQIYGNILFHSVPYTKRDNSSLEYWEFDKLGEKASLGCIRLCVADAKWIYDNVWTGTIVEFYEDEEPGPIGKPELQKISDNEECRNWDPTDYIEGNPWHI